MADQEKDKLLADKATAIQVLETKVASMSETNVMNQMNKLKAKMNTCMEDNHAVQKANEISTVKIQQLRVENAQLQENLQQEVQNGSKALVSGNPNAKAVHLNTVKMELTTLRHAKVQWEGSIREHEKTAAKNLNSTQCVHDELKGLIAKLQLICDSADQNATPDGQAGKPLTSVDFGLFRMKDMLNEGSSLLQLHFSNKLPPSKLAKDASSLANATQLSSFGSAASNPFKNSTKKHNN